jgi:hypothetical protein
VAIDRENYPGKSIQLSMVNGSAEIRSRARRAAKPGLVHRLIRARKQELQEFRSYRKQCLQPRTKTRIGSIVVAVTIFIAGKRLKGRTSPSHSATPERLQLLSRSLIRRCTNLAARPGGGRRSISASSENELRPSADQGADGFRPGRNRGLTGWLLMCLQ